MIIKGGKVGKNVTLGHNCNVFGIVGNGCKIESNTDIWKGVILEDDVFIGPSATFTNVKYPRAATPTDEYEITLVEKGATVGANATIICGVTIGANAILGAGSVLTKDLPTGEIWVGNPARKI